MEAVILFEVGTNNTYFSVGISLKVGTIFEVATFLKACTNFHIGTSFNVHTLRSAQILKLINTLR